MSNYRVKPTAPRLNRAHPLARGLLVYAIATPGGLVELTGGTPAIDSTTTASGPYGSVRRSSTNAQRAVLSTRTPVTSAGLTHACLVQSAFGSDGRNVVFGNRYGTTGGSGTQFIKISPASGEWYSNGKRAGVQGRGLLVYSWDGSTVRGYRNSELISQGAFSGTMGSMPLGVFADPAGSGYEPTIGDVDFAAVWSRGLTSDEVAMLTADPFGLARPPTVIRRLFGSFASASALLRRRHAARRRMMQ